MIDFVNEFQIDEQTKAGLSDLLQICFPEGDHKGRIFYKQLPHHRLILKDNKKIIGQLAIDFRVMNLNGEMIRVFGVIDVAVHPDYRNKGYGSELMKEFLRIAAENKNNIDFAFLVTQKPEYYTRFGFQQTKLKTTWLKIHEGKNYGIGNEVVDDTILMYKEISNKTWSDGELDFLGYWY